MLPIASLLFMHLLQLGALSLLEHMDVDAIHGSVELTATRNQFRNLAIFVKTRGANTTGCGDRLNLKLNLELNLSKV